MARPILHHQGAFVQWSTICDAPVTTGLDRDAMIAHLVARGDRPMHRILEAMELAQAYGTSYVGDDGLPEKDMTSLDEMYCNRAGAGETCIDAERLHALLFVERAPLSEIATIVGRPLGEDDD
jgi:hypothetical protein